MNVLLTIREQDINPDAPIADQSGYAHRDAARAVVLDDQDRIILLNVGLHNYHKLPGGGIDEGEAVLDALRRELLEEIGCKVEIIAELGEIVETRDQYQVVQRSYCYLARKTGDQVAPAMEDHEVARQFHEVLAGDIDEAIAVLQADTPENYGGKFIRHRDLVFLQAAKQYLEQTPLRSNASSRQ